MEDKPRVIAPSSDLLAAGKNASRAESVYASLRDDIFEFRLLPGDRLTEGELAERLGVSRTPVREALQRLQSDGLMQGYVRGGWEVVPIDFKRFENLYELRKLIETFAIRKLCTGSPLSIDREPLAALAEIWLKPREQRLTDVREVASLDEMFHATLVRAIGNEEMAVVFGQLTDRIRIVRRLDFVYGDCVHTTYDEHAAILRKIADGRTDEALVLIEKHIDDSQAAVGEITLHRLHSARTITGNSALVAAPKKAKRAI